MLSNFTFRVQGIPVPQGSLKAYKTHLTHSNRDILYSWRADVALAAKRALPEGWDKSVPVSLRCEFVFPRPKYHYGTGGNANKLKDSAPEHHVKTPDLDKLLRSVGDSLADACGCVVLNNDNQIVSVHASKRYATDDFIGAIITVTALE